MTLQCDYINRSQTGSRLKTTHRHAVATLTFHLGKISFRRGDTSIPSVKCALRTPEIWLELLLPDTLEEMTKKDALLLLLPKVLPLLPSWWSRLCGRIRMSPVTSTFCYHL